MPIDAQRVRQLGAFFTAHAARLHRAVAAHARGVCDATIEEACQTASATLVRRPDVTLDAGGLSWLVTVATHDAYRLARRQRSERPAGAFLPPTRAGAEPGELPEPPADTRDVADQVAARVEHAQRVEDLRRVKPHDRRALFLPGLGYSYAEIA